MCLGQKQLSAPLGLKHHSHAVCYKHFVPGGTRTDLKAAVVNLTKLTSSVKPQNDNWSRRTKQR